MNAGDTFKLWDKAADVHVWVIVSDPIAHPDEVVIANFTSYDCDSEDVCIIDKGEHPWVRHRTCVAYEYARSVTVEQLRRCDAKKIEMMEPLSAVLLRRVRLGASRSRTIKRGIVEIMEDQDLLD